MKFEWKNSARKNFEWKQKQLDFVILDWIAIALAFLVAINIVEAFFYKSGLSFRAIGSVFAVIILAFILFEREKIMVKRSGMEIGAAKSKGTKGNRTKSGGIKNDG
ncbi:MAG: hypothetical protein WC602_04470 [archaeon]